MECLTSAVRRCVLPLGQQCRAGSLWTWIAAEPCATRRVIAALEPCRASVTARHVCCPGLLCPLSGVTPGRVMPGPG